MKDQLQKELEAHAIFAGGKWSCKHQRSKQRGQDLD